MAGPNSKKQLNDKETGLSILFLKNNIEPEKWIYNTNYKKVKDNIESLTKKLQISKENFEKIKDELGISQNISITK